MMSNWINLFNSVLSLLTLSIKEEPIGFAELGDLHGKGISEDILKFTDKLHLKLTKLMELDFDVCSMMAGAILWTMYFHCLSHRLNLVVSDLNTVQEVRNTIRTVQKVITFFRESVLHRKMVPNIPAVCHLSSGINANQITCCCALQLNSGTSSVIFALCLVVILRYSSYLDSFVNMLQTADIEDIDNILSTFI
ncbi:hypothetical protein PR048_011019 [Dryococelus australis]|uniref:Uncharacterized protein n=1 Tax=Dryococelus australis TaxID=614101 RepID=A0ABQ9HKF7_9NEOP|nr:hypothetical protein PR048_011019 [Dryococelus australis]